MKASMFRPTQEAPETSWWIVRPVVGVEGWTSYVEHHQLERMRGTKQATSVTGAERDGFERRWAPRIGAQGDGYSD